MLLLATASTLSGCAEGCPIVCNVLDNDCPEECQTGDSASESVSSTSVATTGEPCSVGAPFGPCDAGTCMSEGFNSYCLHGELGEVCVPTCSVSCPSTTCDLVGACTAGTCFPTCLDGKCPNAMVCDTSIGDGVCVHPN